MLGHRPQPREQLALQAADLHLAYAQRLGGLPLAQAFNEARLQQQPLLGRHLAENPGHPFFLLHVLVAALADAQAYFQALVLQQHHSLAMQCREASSVKIHLAQVLSKVSQHVRLQTTQQQLVHSLHSLLLVFLVQVQVQFFLAVS